MFRLFANPRLLSAVQWTAYAVFFCIVAALAVPFTFPTRQLRSFVTREAKVRGLPSVEIDDLKLKMLGGVELRGVHVTLPGKPAEAGENGQMTPAVPEAELAIEELSAKLALWPALMGKAIDLRLNMDAGGGTLEDGRIVWKIDGWNFKTDNDWDIEIGKLTNVALGEMGIGNWLLTGNKILTAGVDGDLSGLAKLHYGNGGEDMTGEIELELNDAVLKAPELGGSMRMTDLGLGTVTLRAKIGLKANIAALAAARGSEKATVVHIEKLEAGGEGADAEIIIDEMAHILIPPGRGMLKQATIQLHGAFHVNDQEKKEAKKPKDGDKLAKKEEPAADDEEAAADEKADKPADDRLKWAKVLTIPGVGASLKQFERAGYIGFACTGPVVRMQCKLELPTISVGTRGKVAGGAPGPEGQLAPPTAPGPTPPQSPTVVATPMPNQPIPEMRPVLPPQPLPTPMPVPEPVKVEEKKPEPPKPPEPAAEEKKPADDEGGRGRGRRGRGNADDDEPRANARDRGNADEEDDRPKRRGREEGEEGGAEGGEPQGEERP